MYFFFKRIFDIFFSVLIAIPILLTLIILYLIVKIESKGPFIHWSRRLGANSKIFFMPKHSYDNSLLLDNRFSTKPPTPYCTQ